VHGDPVGSRVGGRGQGFAELGLSIVADPDPVDGAEYDRVTLTEEDDAPTTETMVLVYSLGWVIGQRTTNGRGSVNCKDAHSERVSRARPWAHNNQRQSDDAYSREHGGFPRMEFVKSEPLAFETKYA
jgi:hypothetical protein